MTYRPSKRTPGRTAGNRVIHVDAEAHALVTREAKRRKQPVTLVVETLIKDAIIKAERIKALKRLGYE